jgi:hypothetical protein
MIIGGMKRGAVERLTSDCFSLSITAEDLITQADALGLSKPVK